MDKIQEMGNNPKNIIRMIDQEEAKTYKVQLDRKSLAKIKERIAQHCSIIETRDIFTTLNPRENRTQKIISDIETCEKDNELYYRYREEIYTFPKIYYDIDRLESGYTDVIKTMWQDKDLDLPVPHDVKEEIKQWQAAYQGPQGNRFLVSLNRQITKLEAENRRIENLRLPQESCQKYFPQIESCLSFQLMKTQNVHELSSALQTLSSDFPETLESYAQSFYSPTSVVQLVKRNEIKSSHVS